MQPSSWFWCGFRDNRARVQSGAFDDRLDRLLPLDSHDVYSRYTINLLQLLDQLDAASLAEKRSLSIPFVKAQLDW